MDQNKTEEVNRLLEHFKTKPTHVVLDNIYVMLKNNGYTNIPLIEFIETNDSNIVVPNVLNNDSIEKYCNTIRQYITNFRPEQEDKRKSSKEVYVFPESNMLPKGVYLFEKKEEEKTDDNYIDNDIELSSESENSVSEIEEQEGYDFVDDDDDDDFSE